MPLRNIQVGDELVVVTTVRNNDATYDWNVVVIFEVRDSSGVTVMLKSQTGTLKAEASSQFAVSWIPENSGEYELRAFAITGLDNPRILSKVSSSKASIETSSGSYSIDIGDSTIEVPYNFSSGPGKIQGMEVQLYWPTLTVIVDNTQDYTLEISLPIELLEQWQMASNLEYCVGFPFAAFIDQESVELEVVEQTDKVEVLAIQLEGGTRVIDIVGTSLMDPSLCK